MRKTIFVDNEYYHIYNRGTDKRIIFSDQEDADRFFQSMNEFNTVEPIGSIYENSFIKDKQLNKKLIEFVAFSLVGNHYHFILKQLKDKGIEKFMQKLGNGYTKYFNNKYKRTGNLFQGKYKSKHIDNDNYLLHLSAYVNLNQNVHQLGHRMSKLRLYSSWEEYCGLSKENFCEKDIILGRYKNIIDYKKFAESSLLDMIDKKRIEREDIDELLLE